MAAQDRETLPAQDEKPAVVRRMFDAIAGRYDLLNHLLSANQDRRWRRRAVRRLLDRRAQARPSGFEAGAKYLDGCAGTFDLALEIRERTGAAARVVAFDFSAAMLRAGRPKLEGTGVLPVCADALALPFPDASFDGCTVGFGVRNLADLDAGLRELRRVVRPGAPLVVLEFTTPASRPFRSLYLFYFLRVLPHVGRLISRHDSAYDYLPASVLDFPEPPELAARMRAAGWRDVSWERYFGGIVAVHVGDRS
ncbi:MAG: ubiquinone/menaquinone biosynthesis methyltransferase [Longimicrobiales bacterium]